MRGRQLAVARMVRTSPGRHSCSVNVLQHLRSFGPALFRSDSDGNSSRCKVVRALSNAHPLCEPRLFVLRRVPLMPFFSAEFCGGNSTQTVTIPHYFRNLKRSKFPYDCANFERSCQPSWAGSEATSARSTNSCGSFGGASLIWGVCQCLRLRCRE